MQLGRMTYFVLAALLGGPVFAAKPAIVEFRQQGDRLTGLRLVNAVNRTVILGRNGWLYDSMRQPPGLVEKPRGKQFSPVTSLELRHDLQKEFGEQYEIINTSNYLVVQPVGRGKRWPDIFERLHRRFITYMRLRGVEVRKGRFPLVAIVLPDEPTMRYEFKKMRIDITRVAGLYHVASNRVIMHDGGQSDYTAETVRHEAAHQTAYNSGVHGRLNDTPRWLVEGVGTLFEPPAMAQGRTQMNERVARLYLSKLRRRYSDSVPMAPDILRLISRDDMFQNEKEIELAYSVSWAVMFYLSERQRSAFARLLNHTSRLRPFRIYDRKSRVKDFEKIVGTDIKTFSLRLRRFIEIL